MAARGTPGGLGWRKGSHSPAPAAPRLSSATAPGTPTPADCTTEFTPGGELDHTEALERWASTAYERPAWMRDPEPLDGQTNQTVPAHQAEASLRSFTPTMTPTPPGADQPVDEPDTPAFDDATDRFAQFAMRAAETQSLFSRDDYSPPTPSTTAEFAVAPLTNTAPVAAPPVLDDQPGGKAARSGWRPDDVEVSAADMDADAMRLEMLAARASETRESRGDFSTPASSVPFTAFAPAEDRATEALPRENEQVSVSGWRRETVVVSAEEFDADAARLEMLASRAADYRPPVLDPEPVAAVDPDERLAFWRKDAAVVTAEEFDADAARLESLAARGPLFSVDALSVRTTTLTASDSTPFWEQQELARRAADQQAAAEAVARDAAANDEWHARWERVAEEATRRGETPDPLAL